MSYYFIYPILYVISLLPFTVLYGLSSFIYFLLFYVFKYRRLVVWQNLKRAFPTKTDQDLRVIEKQFYKHLSDVFVETIKALSISKNELSKRVQFSPAFRKTFDEYNEKKQGVVVVMGHLGNWEWSCLAFSLAFKQELDGLYHPLSNKGFDRLMINLRGRFGANLVNMHTLPRQLPGIKAKVTALSFIADQTPSHNNAYWTTFLNQDTAVFSGTERIARKLNWPVVYVSVSKPKRGYYAIACQVMSEVPKNVPETKISEWHTQALEIDIQQTPYIWLWSHRRWKRKREITETVQSQMD